jgi:hypothetical protein
MGAGTLVELIARGNQDIYLIGNPQFSFFKSVYRRHTNFAIEPIRQIFNESPDFGKKVVCIIDKKADMLSDILLEVELPVLGENISWTNGIGYFMIDYVELQLGGEPIDRITGDLMDAWMELSTQLGIKNSLYTMIGKYITFNKNTQTGIKKLLIPLPFWFTRGVERALPLISMQYIDVKIIIQFKPFDQCWYKLTEVVSPPSGIMITKSSLVCNYIYLDTYERQKMATQQSFEYLIEQFQISNQYQIPINSININMPIYFNHPVKELIWMYRTNIATNTNNYYNYANILNYNTPSEIRYEPFNNLQMRFNGNDRFEYIPSNFFYLYQPYRHHSCGTNQYIHVYTFALNPEGVQPSGTCNFSKIDNATLNLVCNPNIQDGLLYLYALNYNILRIQNGMAGLMFSS